MKNTQNYIAAVALLLVSVFISATAYAGPPAGRDTNVQFTIDKSAPTDAYIWKDESGGSQASPATNKNLWSPPFLQHRF